MLSSIRFTANHEVFAASLQFPAPTPVSVNEDISFPCVRENESETGAIISDTASPPISSNPTILFQTPRPAVQAAVTAMQCAPVPVHVPRRASRAALHAFTYPFRRPSTQAYTNAEVVAHSCPPTYLVANMGRDVPIAKATPCPLR